MSLLIKNARIVNADKAHSKAQDILVEKGKIAKISSDIPSRDSKVIDAQGKRVLPGLIDLHVHLREPGREDKETIETGSRAAVKGGFTTIMCMPNTDPVIDNAMVVEGIFKEARRVGLVNVIPVGAITKGQRGQEMTDMFELKQAGCLALSEDGRSVINSRLMRFALEYARIAGLLLIEHCEDPYLSEGAVMNEGFTSTLLGMRGDPGVSETIILSRDIELARFFKSRIHFAHLSLKRSVELVRNAKKEGVPITAEVCPHHFSLTEEATKTFDPNTKVNPPLRTQEDVEVLKKGLKEGTIDLIASDHAPHALEDKEVGFDDAPFGIIGLETSFGLSMTELVEKKVLSLEQLVEKMSTNPARLIGLKAKGVIRENYDADIVIVDPDEKWEVRKEDFVSKSKNSPFVGRELKGVVHTTIYGGKVVYQKK